MKNKKWFCKHCNKSYKLDFNNEFNLTCPKCNNGLTLSLSEKLKWSDFDNSHVGVIKYEKLLPVSRESLMKVCNFEKPEITDLIESKKMAEILGVKSVHLLPTISGPSGTFKDLEAAVVIAKCLDWKINRKLSWHSTGNTAKAYREYAIKAGFSSDSYFPLLCLDKWNGSKLNKKNKIIAYDGLFQNLSKIAKDNAKKFNILHLAPLPWKLEGKAIMAYAIAEQAPNTTKIVQTIAGGYGILGMHLGFDRLRDSGLFKKKDPIYNLYQLDGVDTISRLYPSKDKIFETDLKLPLNPFEPTLQSTNPLSTFNELSECLKKSNSTISSVSVKDVINNFLFFEKECNNLGIDISFRDEKSPFISWAGLVNDVKNKKLNKTDKIVIVITGAKKRPNLVICPDKIV